MKIIGDNDLCLTYSNRALAGLIIVEQADVLDGLPHLRFLIGYQSSVYHYPNRNLINGSMDVLSDQLAWKRPVSLSHPDPEFLLNLSGAILLEDVASSFHSGSFIELGSYQPNFMVSLHMQGILLPDILGLSIVHNLENLLKLDVDKLKEILTARWNGSQTINKEILVRHHIETIVSNALQVLSLQEVLEGKLISVCLDFLSHEFREDAIN